MNALFFIVVVFAFAATAFGQRLNTYINVRAGDLVSNILPPPLWGGEKCRMWRFGAGGNHTGRKEPVLKNLKGKNK